MYRFSQEQKVAVEAFQATCLRQMHAAVSVAKQRITDKDFPPEIDDSEWWDDLQTKWTPETFLLVVSKTTVNCFGQQLETDDVKLELGREQKMPIAGHNVLKNQVTLRLINIHPKLRRQGMFSALVRYLLVKYGAVQLEAVQNKRILMHLLASDNWKIPSYIFTKNAGGEDATFGFRGATHGRILTADELRAVAKVNVSGCKDDHERYCKQLEAISLW